MVTDRNPFEGSVAAPVRTMHLVETALTSSALPRRSSYEPRSRHPHRRPRRPRPQWRGARREARLRWSRQVSGSVKLVLVAADGARTSASAPTFADWITYEVTTTASEPYVETSCFQNGKLVYKQSRGFFAGYYAGTQMYQLGPTQAWAGGAATCNARLHEWVNGSDRTLSTTGFDVGA